MPINFGDATLKLNPMTQVTLGPMGGGSDSSLARENLRLMRDKFEYEKKRNVEADALERLRLASAETQEKMKADAAAKELAAKQREALMARRQEAIGEFGKRASAGDIEGAEGMVPFLDSLGVGVSREGEEHGLPRYRFETDPEGAQAAATERSMDGGDIDPMESLGYPTDEVGTLDEPAGIPTTEEAFTRSMAASRFGEMTGGQPFRAAPEADLAGAVPRNVVDMGAMASETERRLNPALSGLVGAYPEPYRESAQQTADSVKGLGLPATKAVEQFDKLRGGPDSMMRAEMAADAQKAEAETKRDTLTEVQKQKFYKDGYGFGDKAAGEVNMKDVVERRKTISQAREVLSNKDKSGNYIGADDYMAGATISRMMGDKGATTENDIGRALGTAAMGFIGQVKAGLYKQAFDGLSGVQRNALLGVLDKSEEEDKKRVFSYLDSLNEVTSLPDTHPDFARGVRARMVLVPKETRDEYEAERKKGAAAKPFNMEEDSKRASTDGEFDATLAKLAADAGLAVDKIKGVLTRESGGDPKAQNDSGATGMFQIMPKVAKSLGTTTEEILKMSPVEQAELGIKYLKTRGVTDKHDKGDYYVAMAAPGYLNASEDKVIVDEGVTWDKDSDAYKQNPGWDADKDGKITVGDLRVYGGGTRKRAAKPDAKAPASTAPATKATKGEDYALGVLEITGY